jgi:hypothetical protein
MKNYFDKIRSLVGLGPAEPDEKELVEKVRSDIGNYGWHTRIESSDDSLPVLTTIGFWERYQHPEIILFSYAQDGNRAASSLEAVARRVQGGESMAPDIAYTGLTGQVPGIFRPVRQSWKALYFGLAYLHYGNLDFPALQLFWPDRKGRFPWQDDFDLSIFYRQPLLYQPFVEFANLFPGDIEMLEETGDIEPVSAHPEDLFLPEITPAVHDALEQWKFLLGEEPFTIFQMTLFGDLFLRDSRGRIHFLSTSFAQVDPIAATEEEWRRACRHEAQSWFFVPVLNRLRQLEVTLGKGSVFSWRKPLFLGGEISVNNVDFIDAAVHLSNHARVAEAVGRADLAPRAKFRLKT